MPYDQRSVVEFNLHDRVGIRLLGASASDAAAVERQLGPIRRALSGEPDITIRFVDTLPLESPVRLLGLNEAGFTDEAFLVLRSRHKARARVQVPLDQVGDRCEIVCESGLPAVPLLIPIINLTMLSKGVIPLHASAFVVDGVGVLTTGWSKGGKTEALLAFLAHGAAYVGDEWVYLTPEGEMFGIPEPVRVWDWYLDQLPHVRRRVRPADRGRLAFIKWFRRGGRLLPGAWGRKAGRVIRFLERQLYVDIHPQTLFGAEKFRLAGTLDRVFWVYSHEAAGVQVAPVDPAEIARRMVFSLQYERYPFMAYYMMYRFAFPDRRNELVETAEQRQADLLAAALSGKEAFRLGHPYPAVLADLYRAMEGCVRP